MKQVTCTYVLARNEREAHSMAMSNGGRTLAQIKHLVKPGDGWEIYEVRITARLWQHNPAQSVLPTAACDDLQAVDSEDD